MRKLVTRAVLTPLLASALTIAPFAPAMAAPRGTAFYIGAENPAEVAEVVEESCRRDPSGKSLVRPRDPGDQAYASPLQYAETLRVTDSGARDQLNSVCEDLPRYLRSLVASDPPEGRVWSACITSSGVRLRCELRSYKPNEKVWINPKTAVSVFMAGCTNPIQGREVPSICYVVEFNYREIREVVDWQHSTAGTFSLQTFNTSLSRETLERAYSDDCLFVEDAEGKRKPTIDCPEVICPPGSTYPRVELARAVGLPDNKPPSAYYFALENGQGILSMPMWLARELANQPEWSAFPCVKTRLYPIGVAGFRGWSAATHFDRLIVGREIRTTLASGKLDRVMVGDQHY